MSIYIGGKEYVTIFELLEIIPFSKSYMYTMAKYEGFPKSLSIGHVWKKEDVEKYCENYMKIKEAKKKVKNDE